MNAQIPIIEDLTFVNPVIIPWGWIIGGVITFLILAIGAVFLVRHILREKRVSDKMRAPERTAFQTLENAFNTWRTTGHVIYLGAVTTALRTYLEGRFGLNAPMQTTTQILAAIRSIPVLTQEQQTELRDLFLRCDQIKFASAETLEPEMKQLYEAARNFVQASTWRKQKEV